MWALEPTDDFERGVKYYEKKHPRELKAVLDNLDTFFRALQAGAKPQQARFGFIHAEPHGVLAIDQKGGGKNLAQTRLYIYPDPITEVLHLITLGDKNSQKEDIKTCNWFIDQLRKKEPKKHGEEEAVQ